MVRRALTVPAEQIAPLLDRLVRQQTHRSLEGGGPLLRWEEENMTTDTGVAPGPPGSPVALGCPECQGGMFESTDGNGIHYLCHVGHSWSPETLISAQRDASEGALYNAASKLLEESAVLQRVALLLRGAQNASYADPDELLRRADHARQRAARIQEIARED
jgi:two-component system chemotaxis response regulator CheB